MSRREYPEDPRVGVGAVVLRDGRVLLVRRGVPPNCGLWAIPGGGLKVGETLREGAEREIFEETGVRIRAMEQLYTGDLVERDEQGRVRFHYVVIDFAAEDLGGEVKGADDALDARWVAPGDIVTMAATETTLKILRDLGFLPSVRPERD